MAAPAFVGEARAAAAWRLAGARVFTPGPGGAAAALQAARLESPLVLLSAALLPAIGDAALRAAQAAPAPLLIVVPDVDGDAALPDIAARLREQLGLEA